MNKKHVPVIIISGKSPLQDSGGYPAYAYTLSHMINDLSYPAYILAIGKGPSVEKVPYGEIHTVNSKLLDILPVVRHLALAGLPLYSILFARKINQLIKQKHMRQVIIWGMGPWGFCGVFVKAFVNKSNADVKLITSYFTSTIHEMGGAYRAIRIKDYGIIPKLRYAGVYYIVARVFHVLEILTLQSCDAILIHYNSSKDILRKYFHIAGKKVYNFPWYNDVFVRKGDSLKNIKQFSHPLIISISRQDPRKGLNFIIRAIDIVRKDYPDIMCLIVGTGSFLELNRRLVKKLHLEKNVVLPGFVSDISPILKEADIAVIVPLAQGASTLTTLEAMSYGKAVVGSDCDGIPEDITDGKTGLIVKKGNEYDLARALTKLIKNPKLRKKLSANVQIAYKKRFGFSKMKNDIADFLQTIERNAHWISE